MRGVPVILREDIPGQGYVGEEITVKRGYARNYLIPRGLAVEASSRNARMLKHVREQIEAKKRRLKAGAEDLAQNLSSVELQFKLKVGEHGKAYGSITTQQIEKALGEKGFDINRRLIRLHEPIKSVGTYPVTIKLHSEVEVPISVDVIVDEAAVEKAKAKQAAEEAAAKKKAAQQAEASDAEASDAEASDAKASDVEGSETEAEEGVQEEEASPVEETESSDNDAEEEEEPTS